MEELTSASTLAVQRLYAYDLVRSLCWNASEWGQAHYDSPTAAQKMTEALKIGRLHQPYGFQMMISGR